VRRRDLIIGAASLPFAAGYLAQLMESGALAQSAPAKPADQGQPFNAAQVRQIAHDMAQKPYKAPETKLPDNLSDMSYDTYRDIRFKPDHALWHGENLPFEVQLFHRGFLYTQRVEVFTVHDGRSFQVNYSPDLFTFGPKIKTPPPQGANLGFSGFRIHGPINRPDYYDEIAVFQGASYFRSLAKGQTYGLSARGLAIKTADPSGEEFPSFKTFWIERPMPGTNSIVVHAILDSESASAAYRFSIRPGDETIFDVEMAIYPRADIDKVGLGPLTSMYYFGSNDRDSVDDFRPNVHDSDGLAIWTGRGERLWRPLSNPQELQISVFSDANTRGFGLMQRERRFAEYEDLEARYETRPSLWVEPIGDWGEGGMYLIEIPTRGEIHDNIVAFWRPQDTLKKGAEYIYTYRLHWCSENPFNPQVATVIGTRAGAVDEDTRLFVIDVKGEKLKDIPLDDNVHVAVTNSAGKVQHVVVQPNPNTGGWRFSFQLVPEDATLVELRAQLMRGDEALSEVWLYRWTA